MQLEAHCIRAFRTDLLNADAAKLHATWCHVPDMIKGGNEDGVFETNLRRDVVAYAILRFLE